MAIRMKMGKWAATAALVVACGLLAPVAFAGGHGHGSRGYAQHGGYHATSVVHRSHYVPARHYVRYSRPAPVRYYAQPAYGYAAYGHYRPHHRWHVGEVLGAVIAGTVITNLISDAVQPRTTVVERTVYRSDPYNTRYLGSQDDGYYGDDRR